MRVVERARCLAIRSILPVALAVAPFTLTVDSALGAAVTLSPTNPVSVFPSGLVSQGHSFHLAPASAGDVDGQKIVGSGTFSVPLEIVTGSGSNLQIVVSGDASGMFTNNPVDIKWDFTLTETANPCLAICVSSLPAPFDWTISYYVAAGEQVLTKTVNGTGGSGNYSGTEAFAHLADFSPAVWGIIFDLNYAGSSGFTIDIPANSLSFPATTATAAVPEPATLALMGTGLVLFSIRRRRS